MGILWLPRPVNPPPLKLPIFTAKSLIKRIKGSVLNATVGTSSQLELVYAPCWTAPAKKLTRPQERVLHVTADTIWSAESASTTLQLHQWTLISSASNSMVPNVSNATKVTLLPLITSAPRSMTVVKPTTCKLAIAWLAFRPSSSQVADAFPPNRSTSPSAFKLTPRASASNAKTSTIFWMKFVP